MTAIRIERLPSAGSTHDELRARWRDSLGRLEPGAVVATETQTAGRGRHGRVWTAPAGRCLAMSVLVVAEERPEAAEGFAWLALAAGLATREAVAALADDPGRVRLKWPNDVLVDGRKLSGVLGELLDPMPGRLAASLGIGVNLDLEEAELPVPHATSLRIAGIPLPAAERERLPEAIAAGLLERADRLEAAGWDAVRSGLAAELEAACSTIGQDVRAALPGGGAVMGRAVGIDARGRLLIARDDAPGAAPYALAAGDVERVRPQGPQSASGAPER